MIPYQRALRRRLIQQNEKNYTLVLSGSLSSDCGYITIDSVKYSSAQHLTLKKGTQVIVSVSSRTAFTESRCSIVLNGETVVEGAGDYAINITSDAKIVFATVSSGISACTATITMPS